MSRPATRLLAMLELLQERGTATGPQIAQRLGVDRRTVRRYVSALQELGIPVEGERGRGGGYRLRPGFRLPPLMLSDDEALAVVLALAASRQLGLGSDHVAVDGALAKLRRVLPDALRARAEDLEAVLGFTAPAGRAAPAPGATILLLANAVRRGRRIHARHETSDGAVTHRELSPYGLVLHRGRWYLAAYDHAREAMRIFRVDRLGTPRLGVAARAAPEGFDPVAHVVGALVDVPWERHADAELDAAARRLGG